ncbi:aminotransferase class V-fold PLP-dependent enzyme [Nostoc sp.]|uniref:aminotransferase class V-fold PLP-dependent enzyme n=1 Tax=Nostoc sp. TaxID=1180 RepID=UPI002FF45B1C
MLPTDTPSQNYPIYLDCHSTTPVNKRVAELMLHYMTKVFGNASSIDHSYGDEAEQAVSQAAIHVAKLIRASPKEVIFTSGLPVRPFFQKLDKSEQKRKGRNYVPVLRVR